MYRLPYHKQTSQKFTSGQLTVGLMDEGELERLYELQNCT